MKFITSAKFMNINSGSNSNNEIETIIAKERLRQASYSFNTALIVIAVSTFIGFVGAALLLSGKVTEGAVTTASGMITTVGCINFAKEANDRLDRLMEDLMEE